MIFSPVLYGAKRIQPAHSETAEYPVKELYSMNKAKLMMALTSLVSLILASGAYFRIR